MTRTYEAPGSAPPAVTSVRSRSGAGRSRRRRRRWLEGDDRVEPHAGREREGNAGEPEDHGVHEDDVGHHHEGRDARANLGPEIRVARGEAEVAGEERGHAGPQF